MQLESVMSMMRYWPAKGTAGLARSRVSGKSRSPAPPASSTPSVSLMILLPLKPKCRPAYDESGAASQRSSRSVAQARPPVADVDRVGIWSESRVYHARITLCALGGGSRDWHGPLSGGRRSPPAWRHAGKREGKRLGAGRGG